MSSLTEWPFKLNCHEFVTNLSRISHVYTCTWICAVQFSEVQFFRIKLFFLKFKVLKSTVVPVQFWLLAQTAKEMFGLASTPCIKMQYLHNVFRYSHLAVLFNMTSGSSSRTMLTLKQKLDRCAAIDSGVHYSAMITKCHVGTQTLTRIRNDSANRKKCDNAAGTTAFANTISWAA